MTKPLLVVAALAACAPTVTYGYQYQLTQEFTGGEEPEAAPVEARQLLANAKTVAFYPPDSCLNTSTVVNDRLLQELRASCGVLMSLLERAAERAGYEVLSWQNLRGGRAIDFAREGKVDVLFEINEFQITGLDQAAVQRAMRFFEQAEDGNEAPLPVSGALGKTCADSAKAHEQAKTVAATGSIDIKTVNVADGRDRWHYRKTREKYFGSPYPKVTYSGKGNVHPLARAMFVTGLVGLGLGIELAVLAGVLNKSPTPTDPMPAHFDPSPWDVVAIVGGAALAAGGIAFHETHKVKPAPETVLCNDKQLDADKTVVSVGTLSAEHTFTESNSSALPKKEFEQIRDEMVADFIKELSEVHGARH